MSTPVEQARLEVLRELMPPKAYKPHEGQLAVHASKASIRIEICGGGWGKTFGAVGEGLGMCGVIEVPGVKKWERCKVVIVEPTYKQAPLAWDAIEELTPPNAHVIKNKQTHEISFEDGSWIRVRSADKPDSLRGEHPDIWIMDEAAQYKPSVWTRVIAPRSATVGRAGKVLMLTTPKGKNWVYRLVVAIREGQQTDAEVFEHESLDSPYVDPAKLAILMKSMTQADIEQEIKAKFIDDTGGIFPGLLKCIQPYDTKPPEPEAPHYVGWDYAEVRDWSVLLALDSDGELRALDRFQGPLSYQISRAAAFQQLAQGDILLDATGGGSQVLQQATTAGLRVNGFRLSAESKPALILALAGAISRGELRIPQDQIQLIDELEAFAYTRMPSGHVRYEAPEGQNDDCVIALALANWSRTVGVNQIAWTPGMPTGVRSFSVGVGGR